eukprot:1381540-Amorphochlora_amoeboformis.AAC.1
MARRSIVISWRSMEIPRNAGDPLTGRNRYYRVFLGFCPCVGIRRVSKPLEPRGVSVSNDLYPGSDEEWLKDSHRREMPSVLLSLRLYVTRHDVTYVKLQKFPEDSSNLCIPTLFQLS